MSQCGMLKLSLLVPRGCRRLVEVLGQRVLPCGREVVNRSDGHGGCREMRERPLGVALLKG